VQRVIDAPRVDVFAAWTSPDALRQWWGPGDFTCPSASVDLRRGGRYRLVMIAPDGTEMVVAGEYREVTPPERLVYTWRWESGPPAGAEESVVTVDFHDLGASTRIVLRHESFPEGHDESLYRLGWDGGLQKLDRTVCGRTSNA
jgi:uncharacterized protein YndB with AHSA1/START domain